MSNLWLIPASNDEAFRNLSKTMANPISKDRLIKAGIDETDREYYAWGTKPGTNEIGVGKWQNMRPNDVCLFYTQDVDGRGKAYHWLAKIVKTERSPVLSEAFWDDPIFELVYFIEKPEKIFITVQDLSAAFKEYRNNYMQQPPMGFMRVDPEVVQNIIADNGSIISWAKNISIIKKEDLIEPGGKKMYKILAHFEADLLIAKLYYSHNLLGRFVASCLSKRFVILTGLSGSGKTKLAQSFSYWIANEESQVCLVPVGADWTNREPLLGYPNALEPGKYIKPENNVVDLLLEASKEENTNKPYFLILDEMNLSHVERYFADFLSAMESGETIKLHPDSNDWKDADGKWKDGIPDEIKLSENLFIFGTVNIDETTYMFSPKVLDRANVIEFRVSDDEMKKFLQNPVKPNLESLIGAGTSMAADFVRISEEEVSEFENKDEINKTLIKFFNELKKTGSEFGYRSASEIFRFAAILNKLTEKKDEAWDTDVVIDAAGMQKLLPKIHGSRKKLEPVLTTLAKLCLTDDAENTAEQLKKFEESPEIIAEDTGVRFKISLEKILRMRKRVVQDGFTSFAEA